MANGASPVAVVEGTSTFKLTVSADMAPSFQVVAYAILPSQAVIAHSLDFDTEKCFDLGVSALFENGGLTAGAETHLFDARLPGVSGVFRELACPGGAGLHAAHRRAQCSVRRQRRGPQRLHQGAGDETDGRQGEKTS